MADHHGTSGRDREPAREPGDLGDLGDPLNAWLSAQVPPLMPPPGTLERVRRRARRRKLTRAATAAAGAAAVIVALAVVPRLALPQLQPAGQPRGIPASDTLRPHHHSRARKASPRPAPSTPPAGTSHPPVPPSFAPASVTFVGTSTGWVIGQAGTPGKCANPNGYICTSLARTDDYGRTWYGVPAPDTGAASGGSGVSQLRFQNTTDGWAFGPQLWATHDGGQHWARIPTRGLRVTALEAVNGTAYAVWAHCSGTGPAYDANCTSFRLYSSPAGSDSWRPVPGAGGLTAGGAPSSAPLLLTGQAGYLLGPAGVLLTGPTAARGSWHPAGGGQPAPCGPGQPGQGALLATPGNSLVLLCRRADGSAGPLYASGDGGSSWGRTARVAVAGTAASIAGAPSGGLVLATSQGIDVSSDGGRSWQAARVSQPPSGGFSYIGMTTDQQGVAVPADPHVGAVWFTRDGGSTWRPSFVRSG